MSESKLNQLLKREAEEELSNRTKKPKNGDKSQGVVAFEAPETSYRAYKQLRQELGVDLHVPSDIIFLSEADKRRFSVVLKKRETDAEDDELSKEERQERQLLLWLLRIKNGKSASRKLALKSLLTKVHTLGPQLIMDNLLPILFDKSLEDTERHLMVKVVHKVLFALEGEVTPYTASILSVISPLLMDQDRITQTIAREVISNLTLCVGLTTMVKTLRSDIEDDDQYVRNKCAKIFSVISKSIGIPQLIPLIRAACYSQKSWKARQTGILIVQQVALLEGPAILPHLQDLINCIVERLEDDHIPLRTLTANTIATLATNSFPYGIDFFNDALELLWKGLRMHRGKTLAAFLRCIACILPLMDDEYSNFYSTELIKIIKREFDSPEDEMKKTVLLLLQKCSKVSSITSQFLKQDILPIFFKHFWTRRVALDVQINKRVTYTTVVLSEKVGSLVIIEGLLDPLRDESEPLRTMSLHAINRVIKITGTTQLTERTETRLIDATLIAFQKQTSNDQTIFKCFETVASALKVRMQPFLGPIVSTILNNMRSKTPLIRESASDLCTIIIPTLKICNESSMLNKLSIVLYESLGEIYPEVLGSIIASLSEIVRLVPIDELQPPANQIAPTLTPILKNSHIKVQLNTIKLLGDIALKGPQFIPPREWMRICFQLLELLKSPRKEIRKIANATFGNIAKAIGPQDILVALLDNLKMQERQLRVCTAVAIGIIAKSCGPYTVIPALMNEYTTPETNVQNGVLKALAFMFEYIGPLTKDYVYFITPLLEDALTDRDLVHRQTAADVTKHIALNSIGAGREDAFVHLLNLVIPNIYETSPHVIGRVVDSLESLNMVLGPGIFMNYIWSGLFHPATVVRTAFWRVYNLVYVLQSDALVPYYPTNDIPGGTIEELDLVL